MADCQRDSMGPPPWNQGSGQPQLAGGGVPEDPDCLWTTLGTHLGQVTPGPTKGGTLGWLSGCPATGIQTGHGM